MQKNKVLLTQIILLAFILSFFCITYADTQNNTVITLQINNPVMTVNGNQVKIDSENRTVPLIVNGRTLVPVRAVTETLGGEVHWDDSARKTSLTIGNDTVTLLIDSFTAYFNGSENILDVAPAIIGGRTMLPIRFIAESFGLSVGWDNISKTVTISKPESVYSFSSENMPAYSGVPYIAVNNNIPLFSADEISDVSFEFYSDFDYLGRCGACVASVGQDIMPTEKRGSIGQIKPTGWHTVKYDIVDGKYLYNRCHLIGYQLTAENANAKNLITGTRYLNINGMLPFENMVADYVKETGNHVMYRSTPIFEGNNLLASGVLLEGYSVEDGGEGISFCVYCYNVQPGISIDYINGESSTAYETNVVALSEDAQNFPYAYVINKNTKKFHYPDCYYATQIKDENRAVSYEPREILISQGYSPCGVCKP